jgi:hypothetical protein
MVAYVVFIISPLVNRTIVVPSERISFCSAVMEGAYLMSLGTLKIHVVTWLLTIWWTVFQPAGNFCLSLYLCTDISDLQRGWILDTFTLCALKVCGIIGFNTGSIQYSSLCESQTLLFDFMVHAMVVILICRSIVNGDVLLRSSFFPIPCLLVCDVWIGGLICLFVCETLLLSGFDTDCYRFDPSNRTQCVCP